MKSRDRGRVVCFGFRRFWWGAWWGGTGRFSDSVKAETPMDKGMGAYIVPMGKGPSFIGATW